ncbi:putative FAD-linked oxidoreductase [Trichoderma ghanense]|uniref:FAD-linked oxidoreductase n=1 Tax=Trichoderma ghanense TaxID=65468 RepID=A0ABY2HAP9_9HYPO
MYAPPYVQALGIAALAVLPSFFFSPATAASLQASGSSSSCRCFPGDACWPSQADWKAFNQSIGGRLIATVPLGSVCHGTAYDATRCANIKAVWPIADTHTDSSSSVLAPFFANQSCDPFLPRETPCVIGTYVQYAVNVSSVADIQKTLAFVQKKNLRLVVRNTGHDYFGKSTGAGGLGLWMHNLKTYDIHDYESAAYTGKAVTMGAGIQAGESAATAFKHGLTIVSGICPTVGLAGGYTQGGGLGPLTTRYGLGADQVLEWHAVLANGQEITATPTKNSDLYWALSGGGGGTYAVVHSMTVKAHANERTTGANLTFPNAGSEDVFFQGVQAFHDIVPAISDAGGTAVWTVLSKALSVGPVTGPNMTKAAMDGIFQPVLQKLDALNITYSYSSGEFSSFFESNAAYDPPLESNGLQIGGRLVKRSDFTENPDGFIQAIRGIVDQGGLVTGASFQLSSSLQHPPNSVNPELRNSLISFQIGVPWINTDWTTNLHNQDLITNSFVPALAALLPGGGSAYLNQADFREPDWQQVFYGENYGRLLGLKNKYDPHDVFWGRTTVGSEQWAETEDKRLCPVS